MLSAIRGAAVRVRDEENPDFDERVGRLTFAVTLSVEPWVAAEAREFVEWHAAELPNRDDVAAFDARFEIEWAPEATGDPFDALLTAADGLAALTGGVVYEPFDEVFW